MKNSKNAVIALLTPSWVSNLVGAVVGIALTVTVIIISTYQGSQLRQEIFEVHVRNTSAYSGTGAYQTVTTNLANNRLFSNAPLFIVWAGVGLIVYYFTMAIIRAFGNAAALGQQMNYVNASKSALLKQALSQLALRIVALAVWFAFIKLTLSVIVPYVLDAAHIAANGLNAANVGYAVLAAVIMFFDVYVQTVFIRLITLKTRVFGN